MIKLYKAFILPHFEYASPLFIGLSKGLSAKLESTNGFSFRTLLNYSKSTVYEELLKTITETCPLKNVAREKWGTH